MVEMTLTGRLHLQEGIITLGYDRALGWLMAVLVPWGDLESYMQRELVRGIGSWEHEL